MRGVECNVGGNVHVYLSASSQQISLVSWGTAEEAISRLLPALGSLQTQVNEYETRGKVQADSAYASSTLTMQCVYLSVLVDGEERVKALADQAHHCAESLEAMLTAPECATTLKAESANLRAAATRARVIANHLAEQSAAYQVRVRQTEALVVSRSSGGQSITREPSVPQTTQLGMSVPKSKLCPIGVVSRAEGLSATHAVLQEPVYVTLKDGRVAKMLMLGQQHAHPGLATYAYENLVGPALSDPVVDRAHYRERVEHFRQYGTDDRPKTVKREPGEPSPRGLIAEAREARQRVNQLLQIVKDNDVTIVGGELPPVTDEYKRIEENFGHVVRILKQNGVKNAESIAKEFGLLLLAESTIAVLENRLAKGSVVGLDDQDLNRASGKSLSETARIAQRLDRLAPPGGGFELHKKGMSYAAGMTGMPAEERRRLTDELVASAATNNKDEVRKLATELLDEMEKFRKITQQRSEKMTENVIRAAEATGRERVPNPVVLLDLGSGHGAVIHETLVAKYGGRRSSP